MGLFDAFRRRQEAPAAPTDAVARADALIAEGHALEDGGRVAEALQRYEAARAVAPGHPRAHLNIGNARLALGDAAGALDAYETASGLRGDWAPAHYNKGNALAALGRTAEALDAYAEATRHDAQFADAWVARGNAQDDLGQHDAALDSYAQALRARPDQAPVLVNMAGVQRKLGRMQEAERSCRRALAFDPGYAPAHLGLAQVLLESDPAAALAALRRSVAAAPGLGSARILAYHTANRLCEWSRRDEDERELVRMVGAGAADIPPWYLINLEAAAGGTAALQRQAAAQFAAASLAGLLQLPPAAIQRTRSGRLRIGYLSADLHDHATMHLLRGVLASHDRTRFHVTAYSYGSVHDATTRFVRDTCEGFRDIAPLPDTDAADLIARDGIDILVDLKGFTKDARMGIVARRPAPVLVSWLGYPGSLGHPRLADWIIGDPVVTPLERAGDYSEALALMPHCYQPNDANRAIGPAPTRAQVGLPEDAFVFCSFNHSFKLGPRAFDVWCRLLREVPGSVLWLLPASGPTAANLRREAEARGVSGERLLFAPFVPPAEHLGRLACADLALDTDPYNSHTTGSDALWAGVPMVTRLGETFASRVGASLLQAVGLPELVTRDWEAYHALARSLALDRDRLQQLRRRLAANRESQPLFGTQGFTRDLERLYARVWDSHEQGRRAPIVLPPEPS